MISKLERTKGMIVGFAGLGFSIFCKSQFPMVHSFFILFLFLGILLGVPLITTYAKKPIPNQANKKSVVV